MSEPLVIYVRVSTREQAENGRSLDVQLGQLQDYAARNDYDVILEEVDRGESGAKRNRPGLARALRAAKKAGCPLAIASLSRAARSVGHLTDMATELKEVGSGIISLAEHIDTTDQSAMGQLVYNMLSCIAQFERDLLKERIQASMEYKVENREYTGGQPPIGWRLDPTQHPAEKPRRLVPNMEEQGILQMIAKLHKSGWSYRRIAMHLNEIGIKAVGRQAGKKEVAKEWSHVTISRIVKRIGRLLT